MRAALPAILIAAQLCAGCSSPLEKQQRREAAENSRKAESMRMRALDNGEVPSRRWAEIAVYDLGKEFDPRSTSPFGSRSVQSGRARVKDFYYTQKTTAKEFDAKTFPGSKETWFGNTRFRTAAANTRGKYEIPNATKKAETKALPVSDARESDKTMATRDLPDGSRPFLGRGKSQREIELAGTDAPQGSARREWWNNRRGAFENKWHGNLEPMTIEEVRELLNKNR